MQFFSEKEGFGKQRKTRGERRERADTQKGGLRMQKAKLAILAILLAAIMLIAQIVLPVYATSVPAAKMETSRKFDFNGIEVWAKRTDTFQYNQWFIQLEAEAIVNGTKISLRSEKYPLAKLYQILTPTRAKKPTTLLEKVSTGTVNSLYTIQSLGKYWWDNIEFVRAPGDAYTWVKYDHPNNYDRYYPLQVNRDYALRGTSKVHYHVSYAALEDAKYKSSFASIAGLLGPIIAALLLIPEIVSKFVAAIIALVGAICSLVGYLLKWFIENIIQTELKDGWVWTWGWGKATFLWWTIAVWFWISFGAWRNWGFFVFLPI